MNRAFETRDSPLDSGDLAVLEATISDEEEESSFLDNSIFDNEAAVEDEAEEEEPLPKTSRLQ